MNELAGWNDAITNLPGAHILQTREWAEFKQGYGWTPLPQIWRDASGRVNAAAMVLRRSIKLGGFAARLNLLYVPRGPLLDWGDGALRSRVLADLQNLARRQGSIFIKLDAEVVTGTGVPGQPGSAETTTGGQVVGALLAGGWKVSPEQIQFRNTAWLDLSGDEPDWLTRMKQKTRYNLRLAQKKGIQVRIGNMGDIGLLYRMYAETSIRDGFVIRAESYYQDVWGRFMQSGMAQPLLAEVDGEAVAGLILFFFAGKAWYLYGMSRDAHREKMPNYLLQWEAMRLAKLHGCAYYDLWGAPDNFNDTDTLAGVFRFKEGLGGQVVRTIGAWDYTSSPLLYRLYTRTLPRILELMRRRGRDQTRRSVL